MPPVQGREWVQGYEGVWVMDLVPGRIINACHKRGRLHTRIRRVGVVGLRVLRVVGLRVLRVFARKTLQGSLN